MRYRLQFRPYRRKLNRAIRLGAYPADERSGILIRLDVDQGHVGYGEVAPLESFGSESVHRAELLLKGFCGVIRDDGIDSLDFKEYPCLHYALDCARGSMGKSAQGKGFQGKVISAALLQPDELESIPAGHPEAGESQVWKLKIGAPEGEMMQEMERVCELAKAAKQHGWRLRLDANERLQPDTAMRWVEALDPHKDVIEFLEQPLDRWIFEDLRTLAAQSPIPVALDESLSILPGLGLQSGDLNDFHFVAKPSLGDLRWIREMQIPMARVVISSVFETAIGFSSLLELAPFERVPGLQTQNVFEDGLSYPHRGNEYLPGQVSASKVWERLS